MNAPATRLDDPGAKTDVLIVGAGPTGLTLANLLGGLGVRCTLVERNKTTVQEPRAVSIDDESLRVMQAAGLAHRVEPMISRGYGSRYQSGSGRAFAMVDPRSREFGFDKRNGFEQPELEQTLRDSLARFPDVTAMFSTALATFDQRDRSVVASLETADGPRRITARYMVACDGARSTVRKSLGIELDGTSFRTRWLIVDLVRTENRYRHTQVFCDPQRSCITLPGPGGIRRYEFALHDGESEAEVTSEAFARSLLATVGPDGGAPLRRVRVYAFHARVASAWRQGCVFLAGDAAHLSPPFAGQGMNSGIRDAHNLAWKLAVALRGGDVPDLLESYERERRPHVREMIHLALNMGRLMMPGSALEGFLVRQGFRLLGIYPPARDYIAQMRYKPRPRFRAGILWPDGKPGQHSLVGQLFPQPLVEDADRRRRPLDELLGPGWSLLVFADAPEGVRARLEARVPGGLRILGLTPTDINPASSDWPVVRDVSGMLTGRRFVRYCDHVLLLRPDRYVAAAAHFSDLTRLDPALDWLCRAAVAPAPVAEPAVL